MTKRMRKPISWLLVLVMLFSMALPVGATEIDPMYFAEQASIVDTGSEAVADVEPMDDDEAATDVTQIAAPVWPTGEFYTVDYDKITLSELPALSDEATALGATVVCRFAKADEDYPDGTKSWNWKADLNSLHQKTFNLLPNTEYKIEAVYRTGSGSNYQYSAGSEVKITTAADPGNITVKLRVIGATEPTETPVISATSADYKGAVYKTWYATTEHEVDIFNSDTQKYRTDQEILQPALEAMGWDEIVTTSTNVSLTAPEQFGGHKLGQKSWGNNSKWFMTVLDENGDYVRSDSSLNGQKYMRDGYTLVFHYAFDYYNEVQNSASTVRFKYLEAEDSVGGGGSSESNYDVSVRVVGAANVEPEFTMDESYNVTAVDYKGGGYQNWLATTTVTIPVADFDEYGTNTAGQTKLKYAVDKALKDAGFTDYKLSAARSSYVTAPEVFGGHKLQGGNSGVIAGSSAWYITVYNGTELKYESGDFSSYTPAAGDKITYHYVYDMDSELAACSEYSADAVMQNYLKIADLSAAEVAQVKAVIAKIAAIGTVTRDSETAINEAETAYNALSTQAKTAVTNYDVLTAAKARLEEIKNATQTKLQAPAVTVGTVGTNSVELTIAASSEDSAATIETCYSTDNSTWTDWKAETTIKGLTTSTKYYFKARYVTSDAVQYENSDASNVVEATTAAPTVAVVTTITDLKKEIESAASGSEKIVKLGKDLLMSDDPDSTTNPRVTISVPAGATVTLDGDNSKYQLTIASFSRVTGIEIGENATLTFKDIVVGNVSPCGGWLTPGNNWCQIARFSGNNSTVNIDGAVLYSQGGNGIIRNANQYNWEEGKSGVTVNIYSGMLYSIGRFDYNNVMNLQNSGVLNIIPKGDIMIEGIILNTSAINVKKAETVKSAMQLAERSGEYAALSSDAVAALNNGTTLDYKSGVRIFTSDKQLGNITAPVVAAAESDNAANADITYTVGDNSVVFTVNKRDTDHGVLMFRQGNGTWRFSSDMEGNKYFAWGSTYTFSSLTKDTEYTFDIQTAGLHPEYKDAKTTVTIKTTFTPEKLNAPTLSLDATKTSTGITLTAPAASTQDESATLQYRMSDNGTDWGVWQESTEFSGLTAGKTYHFQAMYKAGNKYWTDSDASEAVQLDTKGANMKAPTLSNAATATTDTITLTAPAKSDEDTAATVQYRKSLDNETWEAWQDSAVFDNLTAGKTYYFQAKYVAKTVGWLDSSESNTVIVATAIASGTATVKLNAVYPDSKDSIEAGSTFDVLVEMENNPGLVAMKLKVAYDSDVLELTNAVDAELLPGAVFTNEYTANPYVLTWRNSTATTNYTTNGKLATLTFKAKTDVTDGSMTNISAASGADILDKDLNEVTFSFADANVKLANAKATAQPVVPTISGDLTTAKVSYEQDATATALTVTAQTSDDGTLSYQWQKSSNGTDWTDISEATAAGYTPTTAVVGTMYYRCVVTNSLNGKTATATSKAAQIEVTEPVDPDAVAIELTFSNKGAIVSGKDNTELYRVKLNVSDVDKDGFVTIGDAFATLHDKYYTGGKDGFATKMMGSYLMVSKFWGVESALVSYAMNNAYASGLSTVLSKNDVLDVYIWADESGTYKDLYTWFEKSSYSATAGNETTFTVKGENLMYSDAENHAAAYPVGATVTVLDSNGKKVDGFDNVKVGENGQFKLKFTKAGTYTLHIDGTCDYTMTEGWLAGDGYKGATVVPCRATVTVTAASSSGGGGGGGGGGASTTTKTDTTKTDETKTEEVKTDSKTKADMTKFGDVAKGDWYYEAMEYVVGKGLMNGVEEGKLAPNSKLNRAMLVTMLYRLENEPAVSYSELFDDVASGQWYTNAIIWAANNKLVAGYSEGLFGTEDDITREQLVTILHNYAKFKGYDTTAVAELSNFADGASVSYWAKAAMQWACGTGLIKGNEDNTINPTGTATRAEVATVLFRMIEQFGK